MRTNQRFFSALIGAAFLFSLVLAAPMAQAGIIGAWQHDETSGNLLDLLAAHPPGTPTGAPTYAQPGVPNGTYGSVVVNNAIGTSIEYGPSTVDEFFNVGTDNNNPAMNLDRTGAFTIMGWVNPLAPTQARTYRFFSTGSAGGADRGWGIGLRLNNTAGTGSAIRFTTYGIADNDSALFNVTFGEWVHVAATYNNGAIDYYLNGNLLGGPDVSLFGNESAAGRLVIGGRFGGNDADQMNGRVDAVWLLDEVLTVDAIRQAAAESVAIPEPSSFTLLALGSLLVVARRLRRRS